MVDTSGTFSTLALATSAQEYSTSLTRHFLAGVLSFSGRPGDPGQGFHLATLSDMLADKKALTLAVAKRIAAAAEQEAIKNNWNMFIAIVDDGGNLMFLERMDDSQLGSQEVSIAKARSALLFKRPTKALEDAVSGGRMVVMKLPNAVPVEGGVPLMAYGQIIGAIGISGATSAQDGIVAKAGADELERILQGAK
jgi:glc operon protein GlcG